MEALFSEQGKSRFQDFLPCSVFNFSLLQVPQQNICRYVAGDGKRFGQELGVYLLGEVSVFMGEHFRDDIHAELAAVGEADGEVMPQSVERAEALGKSSGHTETINGRAVRAHPACSPRENEGAVGMVFIAPFLNENHQLVWWFPFSLCPFL